MPNQMTQRKKANRQTITWDEFVAFTAAAGREASHAYRVFKGERESIKLERAFKDYFGFPMRAAQLAGRKKAAA